MPRLSVSLLLLPLAAVSVYGCDQTPTSALDCAHTSAQARPPSEPAAAIRLTRIRILRALAMLSLEWEDTGSAWVMSAAGGRNGPLRSRYPYGIRKLSIRRAAGSQGAGLCLWRPGASLRRTDCRRPRTAEGPAKFRS